MNNNFCRIEKIEENARNVNKKIYTEEEYNEKIKKIENNEKIRKMFNCSHTRGTNKQKIPTIVYLTFFPTDSVVLKHFPAFKITFQDLHTQELLTTFILSISARTHFSRYL